MFTVFLVVCVVAALAIVAFRLVGSARPRRDLDPHRDGPLTHVSDGGAIPDHLADGRPVPGSAADRERHGRT